MKLAQLLFWVVVAAGFVFGSYWLGSHRHVVAASGQCVAGPHEQCPSQSLLAAEDRAKQISDDLNKFASTAEGKKVQEEIAEQQRLAVEVSKLMPPDYTYLPDVRILVQNPAPPTPPVPAPAAPKKQ